MTRSWWATEAALAAALLVVVAAALAALPWKGQPTSTVSVQGSIYYSEDVPVEVPDCENTTPASGSSSTYIFHEVRFTLWISSWCSPGGGSLKGSAEEPNGTVYGLTVLGTPTPTSPNPAWLSPDRSCGVGWNRYATATLFVEA